MLETVGTIFVLAFIVLIVYRYYGVPESEYLKVLDKLHVKGVFHLQSDTIQEQFQSVKQTDHKILSSHNKGIYMGNKQLTPDEQYVILHKGTERPFTGKYNDNKSEGTYTCKQCGEALFDSDTKFDSGSGWPSFDDALPGAVKEITDADGYRVEIVCANCGAHLGHVFRGEHITPKSTRHCVNSISLDFIPDGM